MSLRFILLINCLMPFGMLALILYHHFTARQEAVTKSALRDEIRTCQEHAETAQTAQADSPVHALIKECQTAGYLAPGSAETAID